MPQAEEGFTTDRLGRLTLRQPRQGYRFSIDSVLLAFFATAATGPVADLGAGCGPLCLLLHARGLAGPYCAVELYPAAAQCCRHNFQAAGLAGQVLEHDLTQDHPALPAGGFGLVISNPPFGRAGQGRLPPDPARAAARHELTLKAPDLWARAAGLLRPGGRLAVCLPPRRLAEALAGLLEHGLTPKRLRLVHGRAGRPASLSLIEAVKGGGHNLLVEPPLIVYGTGQAYTPEVAGIYHSLE
ncbi:MAG: methyltransferase [Desulfarculus sp.]|nr:methyltransferase [Desulfarculus sp.]